MQAAKQRLKHYRVDATADNLRPVPQAPNRTFLLIQNTGPNPASIHFGEEVQGDGGDLVLPAFTTLPAFDRPETCPTEAINVASELGTTLVILEGQTT